MRERRHDGEQLGSCTRPGRIEPHVLMNHDSVHCVVDEYRIPILRLSGYGSPPLWPDVVWGVWCACACTCACGLGSPPQT